jgi:aspartate/methionine/tyrosine aminotransferase
MRPTTRAVVVNFPHNPTGALLSLASWEALVEQCRAAGAYLFSDEMYRSLPPRMHVTVIIARLSVLQVHMHMWAPSRWPNTAQAGEHPC